VFESFSATRMCPNTALRPGIESNRKTVSPVCMGDTITFTAGGTTDSGGSEWINCIETAVPPGGVEYHWTLTLPAGYPPPLPPTSGTGSSVDATALVPGTYTVSFTAQPTRTKCPPSAISLGSASATAIGVDSDIDSDNSNGTGAPDRSEAEDLIEMAAPGKVICTNMDDDDANGSEDRSQEPPPAGDDDLVPMVAEILGGMSQG